MNCRFDRKGERWVCPACGLDVPAYGDSPPAANCGAHPREEPALAPLGPGTHLHAILAEFGIKPRSDCKCNAHAAQMDAWGPDECERRREEIVAWLVEATDELPVARWLPNWSKSLAANWLVGEAIVRSR